MSVVIVYVLFILGFFFLIYGADWLVDGASSLARRMQISDLVIGLTIVSFGTSAPELAVNVIASFDGKASLAISNILGSNVANIMLVLGASALVRPLLIQKNTTWKEIPLSILAGVLLAVLLNDVLVDNSGTNVLSRGDGFVLSAFFIIFMYYTFSLVSGGEQELSESDSEEHGTEIPVWRAIVMSVAGLIALPVGGNWIVDGAVQIAQDIGLSESVIGVVIVGVGTSLPELAASVMAAYKGKTDIAVGNAVGSNIFNIFWVLGLSAMIRPLPFDIQMNADLMMVITASVLLFAFTLIGKNRRELSRGEGMLFLLGYAAYLIYLFTFHRT
ncbi:MAG: calcium/sodium antiporter [Leptospiraceae bacterium]|nr:calcium/sodium antiporter [Leptospiraceae bacterium]